jgi:hypothetical protein
MFFEKGIHPHNLLFSDRLGRLLSQNLICLDTLVSNGGTNLCQGSSEWLDLFSDLHTCSGKATSEFEKNLDFMS